MLHCGSGEILMVSGSQWVDAAATTKMSVEDDCRLLECRERNVVERRTTYWSEAEIDWVARNGMEGTEWKGAVMVWNTYLKADHAARCRMPANVTDGGMEGGVWWNVFLMMNIGVYGCEDCHLRWLFTHRRFNRANTSNFYRAKYWYRYNIHRASYWHRLNIHRTRH